MTSPLFATRLEAWGDRCALLDESGRRMTYAQLAIEADAFAAKLDDRVRIVAIDARRRTDAIIAYLGTLRRGLPALMFEATAKTDAMLDQYAPEAVYRFDNVAQAYVLTMSDNSRHPAPHPDLAVLLSTSGSTGSAKLVRLSGENLQSNALSIVEYLNIGPDEVAITTLPLFYSYGISVLHSHLAAGATIVVTELTVTDPAFVDLATRSGVTSIAGVPTTYEMLERSGALQALPSTIRTFTQAGGRMPTDRVRRVATTADSRGARLFVMYGQTEATARIAYLPPELLGQHADCIGRAIPRGKIELLDPDTGALTDGVGEIAYTGPNVMMGYGYDRADLANGREIEQLKTGDLGREIEPGIFRIEGRLSRFIKPLGLRISLDELEAIARAAGAEITATGDDRGAVIVVPNEQHAARAKAAFANKLKLPDSLFVYLIRTSIPTLGNGKPDYATLLSAARENESAKVKDGETAIRGAFAALLPGGEIDGSSTFSSLGGDSLSYVGASLVIENAIGTVPDRWENLTLDELIDLARQTRPRRKSMWSKLDAELAVRAVAIGLVIAGHAFGNMQGGANALMLLSGMAWARFQRPKLLHQFPLAVFWRSMSRLLIIYLAIVLAYSAFEGHLFLRHVLFVSTYFADWGGQLNVYWFIQTLMWCTLFTCLLFFIPAVRSFVGAKPVTSGIAFFALAIVIRIAGDFLLDEDANVMRTADQLLVYFAGGWLMALIARPGRLALGLILTFVPTTAWGWADSHVAIMAIVCLVLATIRSIVLPTILARAVRTIARYSFYIYLTCAIPMWVTDYYLDGATGQYWLLSIVIALVLGCGLGFAVERVWPWAETALTSSLKQTQRASTKR